MFTILFFVFFKDFFILHSLINNSPRIHLVYRTTASAIITMGMVHITT